MRSKTYTRGGYEHGSISSSGGEALGPVLLAHSPATDLEAATLEYVQNKTLDLNAAGFVSGLIPLSVIPAFTGELTKFAGGTSVYVTNTGIAAGTYTKYRIRASGQAIETFPLSESDIPTLTWQQLQSGLPTTAAGYGISNMVSSTNTQMTGMLSVLDGAPTPNSIINRGVVDSVSGILSVGDVVHKPFTSSLPGFFMCNNGAISKSTYSDLYAVIGDAFRERLNLLGYGCPWEQQYDINTTALTDLGSWATAGTLPFNTYDSHVFVTKNRVYVAGGISGYPTRAATVYTAPINSDGTLGSWTTGPSLPEPISEGFTLFTKEKVHLLGGYNGSEYLNTIYTAPINADGTIGGWSLTGFLPVAANELSAVVIKDYVYVMLFGVLHRATIQADGSFSEWSSRTVYHENYHARLAVTGNYIHFILVDNILTAPIDSSGHIGTLTLSGTTPARRREYSLYVTRNSLFIIGGRNHSDPPQASVYRCAVNADGTLGAWSTVTSLPTGLSYSSFFATKNSVYLVAAYNSGGPVNQIYKATITGGLNDYSDYYTLPPEEAYGNRMGGGLPWVQQRDFNLNTATAVTGITNSGAFPFSGAQGDCWVTKRRAFQIVGGTVYTAPINTDGTLGTWVIAGNLPNTVNGAVAIVNGRLHMIGGWNISLSAASNVCQSATIKPDGTLGSWSTSTFPISLYGNKLIATKGRLYSLGGHNGAAPIGNIYYAAINDDGTLGGWTAEGSLPAACSHFDLAATESYVYIVGGRTSSAQASNVVSMAPITAAGGLGSWTAGPSLPIALSNVAIFSTKSRVFVLGGNTGAAGNNTANVYSASINDSGVLGSWNASGTLPIPLEGANLFLTEKYLFINGGTTGSALNPNLYRASFSGGLDDYSMYLSGALLSVRPAIKGAGRPWEQQYYINRNFSEAMGSWAADGSVPMSLSGKLGLVTDNKVYLIGGATGTTSTTSVYIGTVNINANSTLPDSVSGWSNSINLPQALSHAAGFVFNNKLFVIGGLTTGDIELSSVYSTVINASATPSLNGAISPWVAESNLPVSRARCAAFVTRNRVYLIGPSNDPQNDPYGLVLTAPLSDSGVLGSWSVSTPLPKSLKGASVIVTDTKVYVLGGLETAASSAIYKADILPNGMLSSWSNYGSLPYPVYDASVYVSQQRAFLMGGRTTGGVITDRVVSVDITVDGYLGSWSDDINLPVSLAESTLVSVRNALYLLGGNTGTPTATAYKNTIQGGFSDCASYYDGSLSELNLIPNGAGRPWEQQYRSAFGQEGALSNWTQGVDTPYASYGHQLVVTNGYVYLLGGRIATEVIKRVYCAPLNADGSLGGWTRLDDLPVAAHASRAIITRNRLYLLGGETLSGAIDTVMTAPINLDGTLGPWVIAPSLPAPVASAATIIVNNHVYLFGGRNTAILNTIYKAPISANGILGSWSSAGVMPTELSSAQIIAGKNRVFLLGGTTSSGDSSAILKATVSENGDISGWSTHGSLPAAIAEASCYVTNDAVYLLGGKSGTTDLNTVYRCALELNGEPGTTWMVDPSLPAPVKQSAAVATKGRLYLINGHNGTAKTNDVYYAVIRDGSNNYTDTYTPYVYSKGSDLFRLPYIDTGVEGVTAYIKY